VARRADISALGIDAERTVVPADLEEMILSPSEYRLMPPQDDDARQVLRSVLFSVKESVFKCVFPATRTYVDFREVSVTLSGDDRFVAEISPGLAVPDRFRIIAGRYATTRSFVVSLAQIPATP
jgi:4'-phosphopantetheinyl transferase EntD